MTCPDLDRLIAYYHGSGDPEVEDHLGTCPACKADLETMILLPQIWASGVEMPDHLVRRIMERIPDTTSSQEAKPATVGQGVITGILATITGVVSLTVAGTSGTTFPSVILSLSGLSGVLLATLHLQRGFGRKAKRANGTSRSG